MSTDPRTDPRTVHRALQVAAEEIRGATATLAPAPRRVARPLLAVLAVAAAVMAVVLGLSTLLGGGPRSAGPAAPTTTATTQRVAPVVTTPPAVDPICGRRLTIPVYPPTGWTGPTNGRAAGSVDPVLPGQLVVHWAGPGGAVEIRWPADPADVAPYDPRESLSTSSTDGRTQLSLPVPGTEPPCAHLRAEWFGAVPEGFGAPDSGFTGPLDQALVALVTDPAEFALVRSTQRLTTLPRHAVKCTGGSVPNRTGTKAGPLQTSAERALTVLLDTAAGTFLDRSGWTRLDGPGGRVVFGVPLDGGAGWVQLVFVSERAGGWVVTGWETSGC